MSTWTPTRFPYGVSTAPRGHPLGNYPHPNPVSAHYYENDFDSYIAADWTVTQSAGSTALVAGNGGRLLLSTAAAGADIQANIKNPAAFSFTPGQQFWFMSRFQLSDAAASVLQIGMQTGGGALTPTDGVFFTKATAVSALVLNIRAAGVSTLIQMGNVITANATDYVVAFYYDGRSSPTMYAWAGPASATAGASVGNQFNSFSAFWTSLQSPASLANLPAPATLLSQAMAVQATPAVVKTLNVDYIIAANEVLR